MANIYKNDTITEGRVNVFLGWESFNPCGNVAPGRMDQNLCGRLWKPRDQSAVSVSVCAITEPLTDATTAKLKAFDFEPTKIGKEFGPTFSSHLFRLDVEVPDEFLRIVQTDDALELYLLWDSNSEGMVLSEDGKPLQGLVGGNHWVRRADFKLPTPYKKQFTYYIEIACNGLFGAGRGGDIEPPDMEKFYKLEECCLAIFNKDAWNLIHDVTFLQGCFNKLDKKCPRRAQALQIANDVINAVDLDDRSTYSKGREIAQQFIGKNNGDGQSIVSTMLHSHIDLAWLWPMASTPAKGARTFSSTMRLLRDYPDSVFVQSQAQLYDWVKRGYPQLYAELKEMVQQGRFLPVGATWVEMDCNIPNGEHLVRQFLHGQRFFKAEFGSYCNEFWLPDTFGYSSQLPQIMRACGVKFFMTQKLSWNLFNKFPHSSFVWEGLDGSSVVTHMPPSETYNSHGFVDEILKSSTHNRDRAVFDNSMLLVGCGDGGGGASPSMLESLTRMNDCHALPKVQFSSPVCFFEQLELVAAQGKLPRWVGELYFELHRGTFTTQADVKKNNRLCELLLCQVEVLSLVAEVMGGQFKYPYDQLDNCWKRVLKNAFHDTLPGSCIGMVYKETKIDYDHVRAFCYEAREQALSSLQVAVSGELNGTKKMKDINGEAVQTSNGQTKGTNSYADVTGKPPVIALSTGPIGKEEDLQNEVKVMEVDEDVVKSFPNVHCQPIVQILDVNKNKMDVDNLKSEENSSVPLKNKILVASKGTRSAYGINRLDAFVAKDDISLAPVQVEANESGQYIMSNGLVQVTVESGGTVSSVRLFKCKKDKTGRELINKPSNQFVIYSDLALFWDGWDTEVYSFEKYKLIEKATSIKIIEEGPLQCSLHVVYDKLLPGSKSSLSQTITMRAGSQRVDFATSVDWHEKRQILRVLYDVNVRSDTAQYDSQFGYVERTTRFNTSWDVAKFECAGHRYVNIGERSLGFALMTDCKYGYSVRDSLMRVSLLRSSKSPDDHADMGHHDFTYALMPHADTRPTPAVVRAAHDLNERILTGPANIDGWGLRVHSSSDMDHVGVSCLKKVEDPARPESYVLRVFEELGGRGTATFQFTGHGIRVTDARTCNMLEEECDDNDVQLSLDGQLLSMTFTPFQIRSVLLKLEGCS